MRNSFLAVTMLALLTLTAGEVQAQAHGPYYGPYWDARYEEYLQYQQYLQWQQYLAYLQQYDPYYELHVMPDWSASISPQPRRGMSHRSRPVIIPRSEAAVGTLPRATGPLPPATGPLPRATSPTPQGTGRR
jgi:hypothetical protein